MLMHVDVFKLNKLKQTNFDEHILFKYLNLILADYIYKMQQSQREDYEEVFEQDQVIWAKVKGYPWWPAYINNIHGENENGQMQYTVYFFNDNTHSKLEHSKIRKFCQQYTQFYQKAKLNRKLKLSIAKAQEKLKQNGENVEIYEALRNSCGGKKRGRGRKRGGGVASSKGDYEQDQQQNYQTPIQNRGSKTSQIKFEKNISQIEKQNDIQELKKYRSENLNQKIEKRISPQRKKEPTQSNSDKKVQKQEKLQVNQSFEEEKQQPPKKIGKTRGRKRKVPLPEKIQQQQDKQQAKEQQEKSVYQQSEQPTVRKRQSRSKPIFDIQSDQQQQQQAEEPIPRKRGRKTKLIKRKKHIHIDEQKLIQSEQPSQKIDSKLLQRLQFCLHNRQQLAQTLSKTEITIHNVKQILDLGVSDILRNGDITIQIRVILQTLKNVLLYKYFPGDGKIKKKYEKLLKRKDIQSKTETENPNIEQLNTQDLQLRKKTILKLENILKPQLGHQSKNTATKIESFFRNKDPTIGEGYRLYAYKVLRSLKDKQQSMKEVINKLQNDEYDD